MKVRPKTFFSILIPVFLVVLAFHAVTNSMRNESDATGETEMTVIWETGFEEDTLDEIPLSEKGISPGATYCSHGDPSGVWLSTAQKRTGSKSLKVYQHAPSKDNGCRRIANRYYGPLLDGVTEFYLSWWIYFPSADWDKTDDIGWGSNLGGIHLWFGPSSNRYLWAMGVKFFCEANGNKRLYARASIGTSGGSGEFAAEEWSYWEWFSSSPLYIRSGMMDKWVHFQIYIKYSQTNGAYTLWVDNVQKASRTGLITDPRGFPEWTSKGANFPTISSRLIDDCFATFNLYQSQTSPLHYCYIDDCVVSTSKVAEDYGVGGSVPFEAFENGFEDGLASWDGTQTTDAGDIVVGDDTSNAHHGSQNLKATIDQSSVDDFACVYKDVSGAGPNPLHFRIENCKFDTMPPDGLTQNFFGLQQGPTSGGIAYAGTKNDGGTLKWKVTYRNGEAFETVVGTEAQINTNYTLELAIYQHATAGWCRLWINGDLMCEATGKDTDNYTANYVQAGFVVSDASTSADSHMWLDCVEINNSYIGPEPEYTLTVATPTHGTTDPVPDDYVYKVDFEADVEAVPDEDYEFVKWIYDSQESTDNPISLPMTQDYTLTAYFKQTEGTCLLTVNSSPITEVPVTIQELPYTTPTTLELNLEPGIYTIIVPLIVGPHHFVNWESGPATVRRTINLTEDMTLTAYYEFYESYWASDTSFSFYPQKKKKESADVEADVSLSEDKVSPPQNPVEVYIKDTKQTDEKVNRFLRSSERILKQLDEA